MRFIIIPLGENPYFSDQESKSHFGIKIESYMDIIIHRSAIVCFNSWPGDLTCGQWRRVQMLLDLIENDFMSIELDRQTVEYCQEFYPI